MSSMERDELAQALRALGWEPTDRVVRSRNPFTGDMQASHRQWRRGSEMLAVPDYEWVNLNVARRILFNARRR